MRPLRQLCAPFAAATIALSAALATVPLRPAAAEDAPTAESYVARLQGDAVIIPAGQLKLAGRRVLCGNRPTVLDSQLDDYGAAHPGFLILNPRLLATLSPPVKLWVHAHECGHQFRGESEETADCFGVQRGRREGWLDTAGLDEVCKFISSAKGDFAHLGGKDRCEYMRRCYADPTVR